MPRTKAQRKVSTKVNHEVEKNSLKPKCKQLIENRKKEALLMLETMYKDLIEEISKHCTEERMKVPTKCLKLTISEMKQISSFKDCDTTSSKSCFNKEKSMRMVQNSTKPTRKLNKRSSSTDDGYLTTEDSSSRNSRSTTKSSRPVRASRSLSRSNQNTLKPKSVTKTSNMVTPVNKRIQSNSYGMVTPKCKPNTPLVLLRRPKMGEVAISMQGSPLMTTAVATEDQANINIPLGDGTMLSLLPQRGLRMSQIPQLDSDTLEQLSKLSENIKTVVELTEKKYGLNFD